MPNRLRKDLGNDAMSRTCNNCSAIADVDIFTLTIANRHIVIPCCAVCAIKLHRKPKNEARNGFYLRSDMEQEQVLRALLKS